ncbi:DUF4926 domain-containing protein [Microcoleus sp. ARI1-B5]|uniref:DUF4926 domain-containing protein n=1 Tax=unclassified Microcoleus TaxID=2642155 RepID=UPI002FD59F36
MQISEEEPRSNPYSKFPIYGVECIATMNLLDVVILKKDLPQHDLLAGQVGTIVEFLAPDGKRS